LVTNLVTIMDEDVLIFFLLVLIGACIWLYIKLKKEQKLKDAVSKENAKLIADNALLLNEHLKFQLQPHTLNNILANLKVFSNKLNKGLDSLSATLEYILYRGNHQLVSVQDELHFIKKYLELNDLFNNEIDSMSLDVRQVATTSKYYATACIPHLITAYLVENAFKHGDVHHPQFLRIELTLADKHFAMKVTNKIKKKPTAGNGGIGLKNMKERLDLLLPGKYEISNSANEQEYQSTLLIRF
jgi:two-component system LytT family sensor kinase